MLLVIQVIFFFDEAIEEEWFIHAKNLLQDNEDIRKDLNKDMNHKKIKKLKLKKEKIKIKIYSFTTKREKVHN